MTFERWINCYIIPRYWHFFNLTTFNYLYHIVFQCDTNSFHRHLPQKLNFLKKFLYYVRNV